MINKLTTTFANGKKRDMAKKEKRQSIINAKPFLKWVDGKGQVLSQFDKFLPQCT